MFIVAFVVLFSGVVSSVIASATTPLVLSFILPVTVPGPASQIPDRVAGWGIATVAAMFAIRVLWPSPVAFPIEARAVAACRAIAGAPPRRDRMGDRGRRRGRRARARRHPQALRRGGPARSTSCSSRRRTGRPGLTTKARAEIRLVDELRWLRCRDRAPASGAAPACPTRRCVRSSLRPPMCSTAAATALDPGDASAADVDPGSSGAARGRLQAALARLETQHHESARSSSSRPGQDQPAAGSRLRARSELPRAGAGLHHRPDRDQRRVRRGGLAGGAGGSGCSGASPPASPAR